MRFFVVSWPLLLSILLPGFPGSKQYDSNSKKPFRIEGFAQGTSYHLTYYSTDSIVKKHEIEFLFRSLDSSLSIYKPYSLISQFNRSSSGIRMDAHLKKVIRSSLKIYQESSGLFDISIYPIVNAWGFAGNAAQGIPSREKIDSLLPCVGLNKLKVQGKYLKKTIPCLQIDVNGIAQGYSVDVIARFLEKKGISDYLVEIGGEIRVSGYKYPSRERMQIAIEQPFPAENPHQSQSIIVKLKDGAITTSGNYRKYIQNGSKQISHLMDPKTGYPLENELISTTVRARDAMTADGYDNALMGMGLEKALKFVNGKRNLEAYFIYRKADGSVADTASTGFFRESLN